MKIVTGTLVVNAFDPLAVVLACVRWYPKVAARDRRLMADRGLTMTSASDTLRSVMR